ncbi:energy transducer TonB [Halomonas urumqiensis]|uniref:Protein TonB n=1 Tax=Halomonas urumqiensis TaxID=1684789 RepID=A0A2N7UR04_9GAMM|nr:energy transducer TonB [Halomonas urumqiensis]PMR82868.1 iron transporter [Halomonas urumqiensis]PTB01814.1 energy transducer TonB [Halomonas urumqiensis]GHE21912.1 hypothetical protein GCM10017767_24330 [Halomonas urumqiensis]
MTRVPVSVLAGISMALLLFWMLALLVSPPEKEFEVLEMTMTMSSADIQEAVPEPEPETPTETTPPAPPEPTALPPMPEPALEAQSPISLPEPELSEEAEPLELDAALPKLSERQPEPEPQPEPQPEPEPAPEPEPTPRPDPSPQPEAQNESQSEAPATSAARQTADSAEPANSEPVDVGRAAPTSQVPPEYPSRAQRRGLEGVVELEFLIEADGRVDASSIRVISARPSNVFEDAARQAVARWRFEPASGLRRARQRLEFQLR